MSFCPTYLHTHTLSLSPSFYPIPLFFKLAHTPLSKTQKGPKKKKKKLGVYEEATAKRKLRRHLEDRHWKALLLGLLGKKHT
jgi:hypothetical protein